jgi:disulfide oxidoreductase YuzD
MLIREEMGRRFGERASIEYVDASDPEKAEAYSALVASVREQKLLYPITVIDGDIVYDGAVSYPAIIRAVEAKLGATA